MIEENEKDYKKRQDGKIKALSLIEENKMLALKREEKRKLSKQGESAILNQLEEIN